MVTITTTTPPTAPLHRHDAGAPATPFGVRPAYRYVGDGRFLPANEAAHEECRRWNAWADDVNARASRSARQ